MYSARSGEAEWALVKSFPLPIAPAQAAQVDLAGVKWSPCGRYIAAWTSATDVSHGLPHAKGPDETDCSTLPRCARNRDCSTGSTSCRRSATC